jgi:hypothetical protein
MPAKILRDYENVVSHGKTNLSWKKNRGPGFGMIMQYDSSNLTTDSTLLQTAIWINLRQSDVLYDTLGPIWHVIKNPGPWPFRSVIFGFTRIITTERRT